MRLRDKEILACACDRAILGAFIAASSTVSASLVDGTLDIVRMDCRIPRRSSPFAPCMLGWRVLVPFALQQLVRAPWKLAALVDDRLDSGAKGDVVNDLFET